MASTQERRGGRRLVRADPHAASVSPLELFFDLVFVFALTQVTAFMAADPTFPQLGRGLMLLVMFAAMAAMLVVTLATPGAFDGDGLVWGLGYLAVRLLHAALFALG